MDNLDNAALKDLLSMEDRPQATIYIPTHMTTSPPHMSENQIRFKNLMHKAADMIRPQNSRLASQLELQVAVLKDDLNFWEQQTAGLLVCAADGIIRMFHLPIDTEEYVSVDDRFHLAPVMGLIQDKQDFYVLELAQHDPQLFKGDMYGLQPAGLSLPPNIRDALNIDEPNQKSENQGTASGPSTRNGWFNGRGGAKNPQEEDRLRFFRMIDKTICNQADCSLPLILAGIDAETAEYRELSKYPNILKATISGNHANADTRRLFETASRIVWQEVVMPSHRSAIEEYLRVGGANPERIAHDTQSITQAAKQGRIDKLLARLTRQTSDTIRDEAQDVPRITFPDAKASKTLNDIALAVWQSSGKVFNLLPQEMPDGALMAARLRY